MAKLQYPENATREGGVIKNTRIQKVGTKGSTHFNLIVFFQDHTYYEEDCTGSSGGFYIQRIWVDEELCKAIIQRAITAHYEAVEFNELKKGQKKGSHNMKVAYAVEYALKKNEMRWDYFPLGIKQADYIISQLAEMLHMALNNYTKQEYHAILNLYLVLYTKIKIFNKEDDIIIQELLQRNDIAWIQDEETATRILEFAKKQIDNPSIASAPDIDISDIVIEDENGQNLSSENRTIHLERSESESIPEDGKISIDGIIENAPIKNDKKEGPREMKEEKDEFMFCRKCGKKLPSDSEFCTYCGTAVIIME